MKQFLNLLGKKTRKKKKRINKKNGRVEEKKRFKKVLLALIVMGFFCVISIVFYYFINMRKVSNDSTLKDITIQEGYISDIAKTLKKNNLIRNVTVFKVYVRLSGKTNLKAGNYQFCENMGTKKIIDILSKGSKINPNEISITFK